MTPMRITLTLDDDVLEAARRRAREQHRPLNNVIDEILRHGLGPGNTRPPAYRFRLEPTIPGTHAKPG